STHSASHPSAFVYSTSQAEVRSQAEVLEVQNVGNLKVTLSSNVAPRVQLRPIPDYGRNTAPIKRAAPIVTASSMKAAGRSLPNSAASRPRNAWPPRVPITAPAIPAKIPPAIEPIPATIAPPERAPVKMRPAN